MGESIGILSISCSIKRLYNNLMKKSRLVFYHFYEKNENYLNNFLHFLLFGVDEECEYIVSISGSCSVNLPKINNVTYIYVKNINGDFGGYYQTFNLVKELFSYKYYFFVNCSVRGPFLPVYETEKWWSIFERYLGSDIGLVGSAINFLPINNNQHKAYISEFGGVSAIHVQTTAYGMSFDAFNYLVNEEFYVENNILDKDNLVSRYEIHLTQKLIAGGWGVKCILPEFDSILKFNNFGVSENKTSRNGDVQFRNAYFGRSMHPYESIFVKTERSLFTIDYLDRLAYSMLSVLDGNLIDKSFGSPYLTNLQEIKNSSKHVYIERVVFKIRDVFNFIFSKFK
jgi:hypothetical protein